MNLIRPDKWRKYYLQRRSSENYLMSRNLQKMKSFNLPASCRFPAEDVGFILQFLLRAAQLMPKAAANGVSNSVLALGQGNANHFHLIILLVHRALSRCHSILSQLFGKSFSWTGISDLKSYRDGFAYETLYNLLKPSGNFTYDQV
jgi:hypothetical protein